MNNDKKQKRWESVFIIIGLLCLLGFGGAMIMSRMEMTGNLFPPEWKTALIVFILVVLIVLVLGVLEFRFAPQKETEREKEESEKTYAKIFAQSKTAMNKFQGQGAASARNRNKFSAIYKQIPLD